MTDPLRIYMIAGEASGDALGADILATFQRRRIDYHLAGLAGPKMRELGAKSLFDISELSVMGFTEVISKLPGFYRLVKQVVEDVLAFNPQVLVLIDSPDFNHAIAKRVKKRNRDIKIVKYICPSVWAWRQGRARKMVHYIDHVLAILPFEPQLMSELGGPPTTYVGHPLAAEVNTLGYRNRRVPANPINLVVLPGSRKGEAKRLLPVIRDSLKSLQSRGVAFNAILPAVDHLADYIRTEVAKWPLQPEIVIGKQAKLDAFETGDVALACSGTVLLELGMFGIPTVSIYKLDGLGFVVRKMVHAWTASLPNLITDKVIMPERFEEYAHPQAIARELQDLCTTGPARQRQIDGFKHLRKIMLRDAKNQGLAADKILDVSGWPPAKKP